MKKQWMPEIVYIEDSEIPMIEVPVDKQMPDKLFFWIYKHTGEFEPDIEGNPAPICDMDINMYLNYNIAKEKLTPELLDQLRLAFGLDSLENASKKGKNITDRVLEKTEKN